MSDETGDDVLKYVKEMLDESKQDIPDTAIDRAHWIGPESSPQKCKAIFVRFTMFCHRTVEKNKKQC